MNRFDGKETQQRLERLKKAFPNLKAGDVIMHKDIAHAAGVDLKSGAYNATIVAFRKTMLRERNMDFTVVREIGYRVLNENERVSEGLKDFQHSVRRMGKSHDRIARADTGKLDENHRRQQDHAGRLMQSLVESGRKAAKQIAVAGRVVSLPRKEGEAAGT